MNVTIEPEILVIITNKIKQQKKSILTFPLTYMLLFVVCWLRNGGRILGLDFYIISILGLVIPYLCLPFYRGLMLGNIFYKIDALSDGRIQFTSFGTLWREEKIVVAELSEIVINKNVEPKLLYKKYPLNKVAILGKNYLIFQELMPYIPRHTSDKFD